MLYYLLKIIYTIYSTLKQSKIEEYVSSKTNTHDLYVLLTVSHIYIFI